MEFFEQLQTEFNDIIKTDGENIEGIKELVEWLRSKDFITAPASTRFHGAYKGGLLEHSLAVYKYIVKFNDSMLNNVIPLRSCVIMGLFHDICKVNYYDYVKKWRKNDQNEWESYDGFNVVDSFPAGHGEKSVFILQKYIKLDWQEVLGIRWHMGAYEAKDTSLYAMSDAMKKTPYILALQTADLIDSNDPKRNTV